MICTCVFVTSGNHRYSYHIAVLQTSQNIIYVHYYF